MRREEIEMFDKLKMAGQVAGMLKDLPKLQGMMEDVRARLANTKVEGSSGGGAVRAVAFCDIRIDIVVLDPSVMRGIASGSPSDLDYANRLIAEAVNDALTRARARMAEEIGRSASEAGINLPPELLARLS
ncbi:MAG: hypothetical protein DWH97_05545 [Planctomycetota bacterium]|nr:MAG: hypothetical protein DWH97_05545 [Planctomycetota bacterium]RLS97002.1 MAG: hypothetical protein DWI12_00790 [Planctomycetota bacterium]